MGDLDENARPIARAGIAPCGASMSQVFEDFEALLYDLGRRLAAEGRHEPEAASIMLERWIVEALSLR